MGRFHQKESREGEVDMENTKETDFLIVGQGLAGTLLSFELMQNGYSVHIIDNNHFESSTKVAAGLINPITGRRFVKSEQIDVLLPAARQMYQQLENFLGIPLWIDRKIKWALSGIKEENDWNARAATDAYAVFMNFSEADGELLEKTRDFDAFGTVQLAAQVNISAMVEAYAQKMIAEGNLSREKFDYELLSLHKDDHVIYKNYKAGKIVFCEGEKGRFNPYFKNYPFFVAKGEVLILKIPELGSGDILKSQVTFCPLGDDLYWSGSNFEWHPKYALPTQNFRENFTREIQQILRIPFEIVEHRAAIRPAVSDRRPIAGFHPDFPLIGIFNGLGSKGTSLGPWWAKQFVQNLSGR